MVSTKSPRRTTRETRDVLGEEDDEDEAEHGNETDLKQSSIAVLLLEPRTGKDGSGQLSALDNLPVSMYIQDRPNTRTLPKACLPSRGQLISRLFIDVFAKLLSESRNTDKIALSFSSSSVKCSGDLQAKQYRILP